MKPSFSVTGPDLPDGRKAESSSLGLSVAVTYASRASRLGRSETYYVRDGNGDLVGRADADGGGSVEVFGAGAIHSYRVAQVPLPDRRDRASGTPAAGVPDGRPATRQQTVESTTKEDKVADTQTAGKKPSSRSTAGAAKKESKASTAKAPAVKKASEASGEKGADLMAALMNLLEERVPGMTKATNKSQTMTRLIASNGKSFAVVFPPRKSGLAVKIPRQLVGVEAELPKGHGFHRTNWGLTRTITKASEAPAVASAFAVAAEHVAAPAQAEQAQDGGGEG